jgi:hypothetical protein
MTNCAPCRPHWASPRSLSAGWRLCESDSFHLHAAPPRSPWSTGRFRPQNLFLREVRHKSGATLSDHPFATASSWF